MSRRITMEEVAEHKDANSCWVVIHNMVYDVTAFLKDHPGGGEVLLEHAGQDASQAFDDVRHSLNARKQMEQYKIGELKTN